jgi:hypothetical protein
LAPGARPPLFKDALRQINELAERERADKDNLPATAHMRKKMDSLGIHYPKDVNRSEAKMLVKEYEERESLREVILELSEVGVTVADTVTQDAHTRPEIFKRLNADLGELAYVIEESKKLGIALAPTEVASLDALQKLSLSYSNAMSEADGIESELEEKGVANWR